MKKLTVLLILAILFASDTSFAANPQKGSKNQADDLTLYRRGGHKNPAWDELVETGLTAIAGGNIVTGALHLEQAASLGCRDALVYFRLGQYYEGKEDYTKAIEFYKKASAGIFKSYSKTTYAMAMHEAYGRVLFATNKYPEAKEELQKAVSEDPKAFTSLFLLGQIAKSEGNNAAAADYFSRALEAPLPADPSGNLKLTIILELAQAYKSSGDFDNALNYCKQALAISPNNPKALQIKGTIEQAIQKKREHNAIQQIIQ